MTQALYNAAKDQTDDQFYNFIRDDNNRERHTYNLLENDAELLQFVLAKKWYKSLRILIQLYDMHHRRWYTNPKERAKHKARMARLRIFDPQTRTQMPANEAAAITQAVTDLCDPTLEDPWSENNDEPTLPTVHAWKWS